MHTTIRFAALVVGGFLVFGQAVAQPHVPTYSQSPAAPGTTLNIGGKTFEVIRVPVRDPVSGTRYAITFPAEVFGGVFLTGNVAISHDTQLGFQGNATIDGFPAMLRTDDTWSYSIAGDGQGGNDLSVQGAISGFAIIQLGNAYATLSVTFEMVDPLTGEAPITGPTPLGPVPNGVPVAEWWKYLDQTRGINAVDYWVDFIRVYQFPN